MSVIFTFTFTREHNRIARKINPLVWGELRKMWKTLFIGWRLERIAQLGEELVYQVTISKISGLSIFPSKSCNRQQKQSVPFNFLQTPLFYRSLDSWLGHSFRILSTGYFIHFVIRIFFRCASISWFQAVSGSVIYCFQLAHLQVFQII